MTKFSKRSQFLRRFFSKGAVSFVPKIIKKTLLTLILMVASGPLYAQTITIGDDNIVRCKGVSIGTKQTIDDIEYEVVDRALLITRRNEGSDLTKVCVSNVTDMSSMFLNSTSFNQAIGNWDVSSVTNMFSMFSGSSFNQSLDNWDVSSVTDITVTAGTAVSLASGKLLWFSIEVSNNNNSLIGYFSSIDGIVNLFYNSTDTIFTNNLLLPIKTTHNDSNSDNKLITLSENPSSYAFTENGIIIKSDGSPIFGDEITELALFTDNNNNSRMSFYNEDNDEWNCNKKVWHVKLQSLS